MTGYECIRESLALFENSLAADDGEKVIKTVSELARRAGYSVYHFTRLFSAIAGAYPKDYLSGRILSHAALRITGTDKSLASIAVDAGFPDYETFSRAFKKRFGHTPSAVRAMGRLPFETVRRIEPALRAGDAGIPAADGKASAAITADREPSVVEKGSFTIAGVSFFIGYDVVSFHAHWDVFMKSQSAIAGRASPETFCQFTSWTSNESVEGLSVICALVTEPGAAQEPFFTTRTIPAARYLRFEHVGDISSIGETYRYIYRDWLAGHDARPLDLWEFQTYRGDVTEIYIPIA